MKLKPIHPFPARMGSEIAFNAITGLAPGSRILDPMTGSGTVLRVASEAGHKAFGFDLDPLAVLMARVWTTPLAPDSITDAAAALVTEARRIPAADVRLPWVDDDLETHSFISNWFVEPQLTDLRRLAYLLKRRRYKDSAVGDALRLSLSRIIVTKEIGASLAADVSHSRPHKVRTTNDFSVFEGFGRAAMHIAKSLDSDRLRGTAKVRHGDARKLPRIRRHTIDAIITSPPYLNAIDYLRGHRLALVWLGEQASRIREVRSTSIGAERAPTADAPDFTHRLTPFVDPDGRLAPRWRRIVNRYAIDMQSFLREAARVLRPGGKAVLVVGDSCLHGVFIRNSAIIRHAAESAGLELVSEESRTIPASRRYLPPPTRGDTALDRRMSEEIVQIFRAA
jgi:DNA modification methylase